MKKLILVRHAKSSWNEGVKDHDRGLENRGFTDADLVSLNFKEYLLIPDKVVSSTAKRAKTTAQIFLKNLEIDPGKLELNKNVYDFSGENLVKTIKETPDNFDVLMVFGHNYALTEFVNTFGDMIIENVPTSGLVVIEFHTDSWQYIYKGQTLKVIFPRDLRE